MISLLKQLRQKPAAGVIMQQRKPDEKPEENQQDDPTAAIEACARALINAIKADDVKGVSDSLYDAFCILESMPHDENNESKPEPHSYDAMNQAAKGQD
jgi:hypothetical protein